MRIRLFFPILVFLTSCSESKVDTKNQFEGTVTMVTSTEGLFSTKDSEGKFNFRDTSIEDYNLSYIKMNSITNSTVHYFNNNDGYIYSKISGVDSLFIIEDEQISFKPERTEITGKKDSILGYECFEYIQYYGAARVEYWVAKDLYINPEWLNTKLPDLKQRVNETEGFALKMVTYYNGTITTKEAISIEIEKGKNIVFPDLPVIKVKSFEDIENI